MPTPPASQPFTDAEYSELTRMPGGTPMSEVPIELVPAALLRVWAETCEFSAGFAGRIAPALGKPARKGIAIELMESGAAEYRAELARREAAGITA